MCYYNGIKVIKDEKIRLLQLEKLVANYSFLSKPLFDGFAYGNHPVLKKIDGVEDFDITEMEWGFLPDSWYKKPIDTREKAELFRKGFYNDKGVFVTGITTLNAMAEELLLPGKIYRESTLKRRCLILSTGFFEWRHVFGKNKRTGKPLKTALKIPHYISLKKSDYFYIAGIWKPWTDIETGETIETLSLVTTEAPEGHLMYYVHNSKKRMPTILNEELGYEWMLKDLDELRMTEIAKTQYPSQEMQACTIVKNFKEQIDPVQPFEYLDIPPLELIA